MISSQYFAGNQLNRSIGDRKNESFLLDVLSESSTRVLVVTSDKRGVKTVLCECSNTYCLHFMPASYAVKLTNFTNLTCVVDLYQVVLLGFNEEHSCWNVAIDIPDASDKLKLLYQDFVSNYSFESGRSLLTKIKGSDLAVAGQAVSMCTWHDSNLYCGRNGLPTVSIECGMKRKVAGSDLTGHSAQKLYPRIDPVAIVAVLSPDLQHILLGHMNRSPTNFYSCLSGFVEPCESVQEAVCREVFEESGVFVDQSSVRIVDSQPWPIGRGGGCELMIGCIAIASTTEINIGDCEVCSVKWFSVAEAYGMLVQSRSTGEIITNKVTPSHPYIPGVYAIAHHLVGLFVSIHSREVAATSPYGDIISDLRRINDTVCADNENTLSFPRKLPTLLFAIPALMFFACRLFCQ
mmetsp:Transcript_22632/g.33087  ORF Transcript_22632/g.33087 Transcript_22632/m.33087 type:complete len:406 (-) Transcript_22632:67-1284(-)